MSLLTVSNLAYRHLTQPDLLFQDVSFVINRRDRTGLVGPNGAGKTTLLRILTGELEPSSGTIARRHQLRISYVPQESSAPKQERLEEYVLTANAGLGELHREMRELEDRLDDSELAACYANLLNDYEAQGGFQLQAEAERVLEGLGFNAHERDLPMAHLSSGQRARAELAKLLLAPADLLLIDEPTNHLDLIAREWLEDYLSRLDVAYVVVSHDRIFLSRTTTRTFQIRRGTLTVFEGNYQLYRQQRVIQERQAWEHFEAQQRRITAAHHASRRRMKLARKVEAAPKGIRGGRDFYGRKAAKVARTARILRERVLREPPVEKPWQEDPIPPLDFPNVARTSHVALHVEGLSKAYGNKRLFQDLTFSLTRGERWAMLGPNGSGKTTLLRILLGQERPDTGTIQFGAHVRLGYYAQEGENLDPARCPVELCLRVHPDESWVRTILGCLRLRGEQATRPIGTMSAGERSKVALARLLLSGANLLLLDEPTNHLDIEAREAVEGTLTQFPGTILFVSHDRYFMSKLADGILHVSPQNQEAMC